MAALMLGSLCVGTMAALMKLMQDQMVVMQSLVDTVDELRREVHALRAAHDVDLTKTTAIAPKTSVLSNPQRIDSPSPGVIPAQLASVLSQRIADTKIQSTKDLCECASTIVKVNREIASIISKASSDMFQSQCQGTLALCDRAYGAHLQVVQPLEPPNTDANSLMPFCLNLAKNVAHALETSGSQREQMVSGICKTSTDLSGHMSEDFGEMVSFHGHMLTTVCNFSTNGSSG